MLLATLVLAAWRTTRLLTEDTLPLVARPRAALAAWARRHGQHWLDEFVTCPHCVGVWVSALLVAALDVARSVPHPVLVGAATAGGVSLIADVRPERD